METDDSATGRSKTIEDLIEELADLEAAIDDPGAIEELESVIHTAELVRKRRPVRGVIRGYDRGDFAEAFLGALLFGIPMFVEGGTYEIGGFLASNLPLLLGTHVITIAIVIGILYVADFRDVRIHAPILGVVPRRVLGVMGASLLTASVMMTVWGTVTWGQPIESIAAISVAHLPMAIGATIGDILPGS